ncbi:MAG: hypothetical protein GY870_02520 [archaeon]|nr:hypothetical protein [archaeon]
MSEKFIQDLDKLEEIYNLLLGEPDPDEEEEAQQQLVKLFQSLINNSGQNADFKPLLEETFNIIQKWDTLEHWFKEVPNLSENIGKILGKPEIEEKAEVLEKTESEKDEDIEKPIISDDQLNAINSSKEDIDSSELTEELKLKLSLEITDAIIAATENLPTEVNIDNIAKTVSGEVTKSFYKKHNIEFKEEKEKKGISREDVMLDVLQKSVEISKKTQKKKSLSNKPKLQAPKVIIPKVTKPMKRIIPKKEEEEIIEPFSEVPEPPSKTISIPQPKKIGGAEKQIISTPPKKPKITIKSETKKEPPVIKPEKIKQKPSKPQIVIKSVGSVQQGKNITVRAPVKKEKAQIKSVKQSSFTPAPDKPTAPKISGAKPKISNVSAQSVKVETKKNTPSPTGTKIVKPMNVPVNSSKNTLFEAFSKPLENKDQKKTQNQSRIGGIKAVSISGESIDSFGTSKIPSKNNQTFIPDESPSKKLSKDDLYQELIAMEGKKYAVERARKEVRIKHEKGEISAIDYRSSNERNKMDLEHISKKINEIRDRIQAL